MPALRSTPLPRRPLALALRHVVATCALTATAAHAADTTPDARLLDRVQVTATRTPRAIDRTPAAVTVIQSDALSTNGAGASLSEKLAGTPGVLARNRQNYAQDEQISIRGFGTRASFGIRSVRVLVDGIPATMPDGQGQVSQIPLADVERIEVLRGPFAALYGNGAGGVVQLFTADGGEPDRYGLQATFGSFETARIAANTRGQAGRVAYSLGASHFETGGWREHSRARREGANVKLQMPVGNGRLTLLANAFDSPDAQDPQGLTRTQVDADPRQASAGALRFDARKSARQVQAGAIFEQSFGDDGLRVLVYGGRRRIEQVLTTPEAAQRNPLSAGGWVDLDAPFAGIDARWTWHRDLAARPLDIVLGIDAQSQKQHRRGYENFVGTQPGVRGRLRQQQDDRVTSVDPYLQATWDIADAWTLSAGVRASRVRFESSDRYITAGNPDDSGRVRYSAVSPVVGATWRASRDVALYGAFGRGFETPTFNELGYRSDGGSGLNFALRPMRMRNAEVGARVDLARAHADLALFQADTRDELVVNTSSGGRTTFLNAGRSRRRGVEAALKVPLGERWRTDLAWTWLDATFRDAFVPCVGPGCAPTPAVPAGTPLPGVPRSQLAAAVRYGAALGWQAQVDAQHVGAVTTTTAGTVRAEGYTLLGASVGYRFAEGRVFFGASNLLNRRYIGSVIVNESNQRYFEPGAGRAFTLGIELDIGP